MGFDARRVAMIANATENASTHLPMIFESFFELFSEVQPLLKSIETACQSGKDAVQQLSRDQRRERCRIFYDGTADDCTRISSRTGLELVLLAS